jgi:uncharacterized phage protein (TIGR01671 family)
MILTQDNNHVDNSLKPKYHLAFTLWVDLFPVDPNSVGQFTGLVDKNGKEVFEGNIVRSTNYNEFVYEVVYNDKRFASFGLRRKQDVFMHYFGEAIEADECEVIGNIHDNPDMIEKGGEQ